MTETELKTAIITGASRGIGRAITQSLAADGYNVVINYAKSTTLANDLAQSLENAFAYQADVRNEDQVKRMVASAAERFGRVDILINCAGVTSDALSARLSAQAWHEVLDTNLTGAFYCCKAVQRYMLRNKWGRIISIGSIVGQAGNSGQVNYAASKAGLVGLTRSLAQELGPAGITVNVIAPGMIDTAMLACLSREKKREYLEHIPIGRYGRAEEVAALVSYLCSERAGYITGQVIGIDGGLRF